GLAAIPGAVVTSVVAGSPAAQAGIQQKDLIVSINGQAVKDTSDLQRGLWTKKPGDQISVVIAPPQKVAPGAAATVVAEPTSGPAVGVAGLQTRQVQVTLAESPSQPGS